MTNPRSHLSRALTALLWLAILGCFLAYVSYQARFLLLGPQIRLIGELAPVQNERRITLTGVAENITAITLNGRPIVTTEAGYFEEPVVLENGYTVVTIAARDRYGREAVLRQPFVYTPKTLYTTSTN